MVFKRELEKQIAELEKDKAYADKQLDEQIQATLKLQKENAELKEKINILENCDRLGDMITEAYKEQLTKAKEILQTVFDKWEEERWILQSEEEVKQIENLMKQTEQFIKDIEK